MEAEEIFTSIPMLETDNYILRGIAERDGQEMLMFMSDKETMQFITPDPVRTKQDMRIELESQLGRFSERKEIPWVIASKENGDIVGKFSLHKLDMWHKKAEMGVVIRKEYQNKGVMSEVLEHVLDFGFKNLGLNRIVGDIFAENQGSEKILKNYGFRKEGTLRQTDFDGDNYHDTVVFSLLKDEYNSRVKR